MKSWNSSPWLVGSIVIFAAILLCSYSRLLVHLCGITVSRNRVQRRRLLVLDESNPDDLSLQLQSRGLEFSAIHSLPVSQFREKCGEEATNQTSNTDCAVCLVEFKEGEWLRQLPNCSHSFHISCIDTWFLSHSSCPLCRSEVQSLELGDNGFSISVQTLIRTLDREDFFRERAVQYRILRTEILQNSETRHEPDGN